MGDANGPRGSTIFNILLIWREMFCVRYSIDSRAGHLNSDGYYDEQLNFKAHIESIARRQSQMTGAARRFCLDIKSPITINRIFRIYMQPIIDYGSIIWNQNRLVANSQITLVVKRITRYAMGISQYTASSNYICFEKS